MSSYNNVVSNRKKYKMGVKNKKGCQIEKQKKTPDIKNGCQTAKKKNNSL